MIELYPEGFEEVEKRSGVELVAYTDAAGEERMWHVFGMGDAADVEDGWEDRWRNFHRPVRVGGLWVGPPWEVVPADALAVVVDPGRAFGTGAHPTTQLCLELLQELEPGSLLDVGCGSGVLAIAAAKLGFAPVRAVDHEAESVTATIDNARANGVEVEAARADLRSDALAWAPTVTANLLRPLLLTLCTRLPDPAPATLIASGLLAHEAGEVAEVFAAAGLRERARRERGEWAALLLTRE